MTEHSCPACTQPAPDGLTLCWDCAKKLTRLLADLAEDIRELETQLTRQNRSGPPIASRAAERPVPFDEDAAWTLADVRSVLVGWIRVAVDHDGKPWPADTLPAMLRRLRRTRWQTHEAADELLDELGWLHKQVLRVIDHPAERHYLGPCTAVGAEGIECDGDVYAVGSKQPRCRDCGASYSRDQRMDWILEITADQLVTASEAAGALSAWGPAITSDAIRLWAHRGRLAVRGHRADGRPMYRFDECRALAAEAMERRRVRADA